MGASRRPDRLHAASDVTEVAWLEESPRPPSRIGEADWTGTPRYRVVRKLGEGGMGAVYEAFDRERGHAVALKALLRCSPEGLYRFKREFRALADVRHANLVRLHELVVVDEARAFFSMELVRGLDFVQAVSRADRRAQGTTPADLDKLRSALRQLVEGVSAMHAAGKLHRDLKPSNVMVAPDGRVVILDFGIATELADSTRSHGQNIVGTPAYMAPEQATGKPLDAACDWYGVGAILYEALVGELPFLGHPLEVLLRKTQSDPPPPCECVAGVSADLDAVCRALLDREPQRRPAGREILERLGVGPSAAAKVSLSSVPAPSLIGREPELRALHEAFEVVRGGRAITVAVSGEGGIGKSSLVEHFVGGVAAGREAFVLRGRAYERESVPYKAVDGVIDALSQLLVKLDRDGEDYIPRSARSALARLFPVLLRVPSISEGGGDATEDDPQPERRRAFEGLRQCLVLLARRRPLVVFIDDVQWGDADSAVLLAHVMRQPGAPELLLLTTSREEAAEASPFLAEMAATWPGEIQEIRVGGLELSEAHALASSLMGTSVADPERAARAVVREARGSPLLIRELVRSCREIGLEDETLAAVTLEHVIARRLEALPPRARTLAEMVAVAGRPLPVATFAAASGLTTGIIEILALLETQGLARTGLRSEREVAEPVHDRIREVVVELIQPSELREHHRRLAAELSASPGSDLEALAIHLLGGGETEAAMRAAERAAEQAIAKLAFEQATRLLRMAIGAVTESSAEAIRLRVRLAETLASAGRPSAAADEYAKAATGSTGLQRIELERATAEQLIVGGRIDEGRVALHRVVRAMGLKVPRSAIGIVLLWLLYQLQLRLVGLRIQERGPEEVSHEDRVRIKTLTVLSSLNAVDVILGACMQMKQLLVAMQRGDRMQVLLGLCFEMVQRAGAGGPEGKRERMVTAAARQLAAHTGPEGEWLFQQCIGLALYHRGRFRQALERFDLVVRTARRGWTVANARLFGCYSCSFSGRYRELARRGPRLLRQVEERGDLYTAVNLRATVLAVIAITNDDPDEARRHVREAMSHWSKSGFYVQHWYAMWSEVVIELYVGDGARARARFERDARALRRSLLLHAASIRGLTSYLQGCCAIASIEAAPAARGARVAEARRIARRFETDTAAWAPTYAAIIRAGADNADGDPDSAATWLREAVRRAEAADLDPQAWGARYQLGRLLGGDEGRELVAQAERSMRDEGVRSPERIAAWVVPGRWR